MLTLLNDQIFLFNHCFSDKYIFLKSIVNNCITVVIGRMTIPEYPTKYLFNIRKNVRVDIFGDQVIR